MLKTITAFRVFFTVCCFALLSQATVAQTTLTDGDLAFTRINGDDPDSFSFLLLEDIQSSTTILFSTEYWDAAVDTFSNYYFTLQFTATSAISAGEEIHVNADLMSLDFSSGSTLGTISSLGPVNPFAGNLIHSGGDNILAFQGSKAAPSFIAGISSETGNSGTSGNSWQTNFSVNDCQLPAGRVNAQNGWLGLYPFGTSSLNEYDNARYKETALHSGDKATIMAAIMDVSNWEFHGSDTFGISVTPFNVTTAAGPVSASMSSVSGVSCFGGSDGSLTVTATPGTPNYTYSWSNGSITSNTASVTNTISSLASGVYTVTITDNNGTTATAAAFVSQPTVVTASNTTSSNVTCNGGSDGSASTSGSGGASPYTYTWSNGATTSAISSVSAGTYTVTITDNNGCTTTASRAITEPASMIASISVDSTVSCNGFSNGGATASATGGTAPYTYLWSNSATTASITGVTAGTYTVTITDNNACTNTENTTITEPALLAALVAIDSNVSCNGFSDGGASSSASGGTAPYTYLWSNSATTASITGVTAGTYTVTITDNNGCTGTNSGTVTEPATLVAATVVDSNASCNGLSDGGATASATGGTAPYTYLWSNAATTASITGVSAGTYTVTLTDNRGCTDTETATVTEPATLTAATVVANNVSCNGFSDGGATASATGGTAPYTYLWSNSATTASITGVTVGTYTVTITDNNGCTGTDNSTITEPAALTAATVVNSNVSINGGADGGATASATGGTAPYTYLWSNSATTASISGVTAGTYTVTITDNNACTDSDNATITEPASMSAAVVIDSNVSCNGLSDGGATASATGGTAPYTYLWSNAATTASITGVTAGTYTITITDNNGGTAVNSGTVTEPAILSAAVTIDSNVSCNGLSDGGATASGTGGTAPYTYLWSNSATTAAITGVTAGTYTVTITDNNGCSGTNSGTVTEPATLIAATVVDSNVSCNGFSDGGATASATGGTAPYTYLWSNSATTASITGVTAGTYTVTITDNNGCTDTDNSSITEPSVLIAATVVDSNTSINGASDGGATASATGGTAPYTYLWSNSATTASITGVTAGTYSVTITDNNGCTDSDNATITEPASLLASVTVDSNVSCNGLSDGGATASASGGTTPYTYLWSNAATTASITGVTAGTYTVTITDNNGGTAVNSGTITEPASLIAATGVDSNVSCNGLSDGGATASATGGTAPYTYLWSNSATTASITGVTAGTYNVTITDNNGCTDIGNTSITEPAALMVTAVVDSNASINGASDGGATASATGGTAPYTYLWSNSATTASITGVMAGTYTVTLSDNNGCSGTANVTITEPPAMTVTAVVDSNASCNGLSNGGASVTINGGVGPYTYSWSNGGNTPSITGVGAGTYTVTVTDANTVSATDFVSITEPALLVASATEDSSTTCFGGSDGGATASATGGTAPYTYTWSNSATTASITGVTAGIYTVTTTDNNGCTSSSSVTVNEPAEVITPLSDAACLSYTWAQNGITYTQSGTYDDTLQTTNGCDSILRLSLTINTRTSSTVADTACNSYTWAQNGMTYTQSGAYSDTLVGANGNGCDSIITLNLLIKSANVSVVRSGFDLIALATGGNASFQWIDCGIGDTAITGATNYIYTAVQNGFYAVVVTEDGCTDTSQCINVINIGIGENALEEGFNIYPNPAKGKLTIELSAQQLLKERVQLYDLSGSLIRDYQLSTTKEELDISELSEGVYMLRIGNKYKKVVISN